MKKKMIAAAALSAAAMTAFAADVNIYGVVDTGFTYTHEGNADSFAMTAGNYAGSRWGIKGSEKLTDSLKVGFILESGFASDSGKFAKDNTTFNRETQLYLEGSWGKIGFGRFGAFSSGSSSMSWYWDLEPFETGYYDAGTQATMVNIWTLHSNSMYYVSPVFNGMKIGLQYSMTGDDDDENPRWGKRDQWFNGAVRYDSERIHALVGIEAMKFGNGKTAAVSGVETAVHDYRTFFNGKAAIAWDALPGVVRLYAGAAAYRNARYVSDMASSIELNDVKGVDGSSGKGFNGWAVNLGGRYTVSKADFLGQVQYLSGKSKAVTAEQETDKYSRAVGSIGMHYHFSGRTMGYLIASYGHGSDLLDGNITYAHAGIAHFF